MAILALQLLGESAPNDPHSAAAMTTPSTDSLKAAPATRPVEIDLAGALSHRKSLGSGLPEGVQRILAAVLLIPAAFVVEHSSGLVGSRRAGPFFFRQDRVGREGSTFRFEDPNHDQPIRPRVCDVEDTRVVPTGPFLRHSLGRAAPVVECACETCSVGPRPEQPGPMNCFPNCWWATRVGSDKPGMVALSNLQDGYARSIPSIADEWCGPLVHQKSNHWS